MLIGQLCGYGANPQLLGAVCPARHILKSQLAVATAIPTRFPKAPWTCGEFVIQAWDPHLRRSSSVNGPTLRTFTATLRTAGSATKTITVRCLPEDWLGFTTLTNVNTGTTISIRGLFSQRRPRKSWNVPGYRYRKCSPIVSLSPWTVNWQDLHQERMAFSFFCEY